MDCTDEPQATACDRPNIDEALALRPRPRGTPFVRWLYEAIRAAILEGRLSPGSRLPSRITLACRYGVSIGTVIKAFDRLLEQGYVDVSLGKGTYVRSALPDALAASAAPRARAPAHTPRRALSARGRLLATRPLPRGCANRSADTFQLDRPALDTFPIETWSRLAACRLGRYASEMMARGDPLGFPPLRAAIADYVGETRGVRCTPDQVVITCGTEQSLDLVARLLLDPGDRVWMEDPGPAAAFSLLRAHGMEVTGVAVDAQGFDCDCGQEGWPLARLAYVTPASQFPLGMSMSAERRMKLLQWASHAGAWLFEDDCDGQLQFGNESLPALHSLDRAKSVIYSSSFNRMLFPSLRLGFLILPPPFIEPAAAALSVTRRCHPVFEQAILADFIGQGHLELHMRKMRELYAVRREALLAAAGAELGGLMRFDGLQRGSQLIGWLAPGLSETEVWRRAAARGIDSVPLSTFGIRRRMQPALVFGIGAADPRAIKNAIRRLGRVLRVLAWQTRRSPRPPTAGDASSLQGRKSRELE